MQTYKSSIVLLLFHGIFSALSARNNLMYNRRAYEPPSWSKCLDNPPLERIQLGLLPTPVHPWKPINFEKFECWIKRDDLSSFDLSGNKVRKLEFLLARALSEGHDSVVTIGGIQSNHARATACSARQLGLEPHLILRTAVINASDIGLEGNLMLDRLVGAKIYTVTPGNYARFGSERLTEQLKEQLQAEGKSPYVIPVGGSDPLGCWGYLEGHKYVETNPKDSSNPPSQYNTAEIQLIKAIRELIDQTASIEIGQFDHLVFACGSGGTATGIALGARLAGMQTKIHAVGVCDSPEYFYGHMREVSSQLGVDFEALGEPEDWCTVYPGQGIGYARSTEEELTYITELSRTTGIVLDPVYSGKALYYFSKEENQAAAFTPGEKILFLHTGGVLGIFDKASQLRNLLPMDDIVKLELRAP